MKRRTKESLNEYEPNWKHPMSEYGNTGTDLNRPLKAFPRTKSLM